MLVGEPAGKGGHHSLPGKDHLRHSGVSSRGSAGQCGAGEDAMEVGRDFLQVQVIILVAVGAADLVEVLPFCFLRGEGRLGVAA